MSLLRVTKLARSPVVAMILVSSVGPVAADADLCIRCTQPDDTYVCRIRSETHVADGQQLFCIMSIAQQYGHGSCASTQQKECSGRLVEYDPPQPLPGELKQPDSTNGHEGEAANPAPAEKEAVTPGAKQAPKTLVEFTQQTAVATKKGFEAVGEKTGEAITSSGEKVGSFTNSVGQGIKDATKKTFNCLTSLFTRCGE